MMYSLAFLVQGLLLSFASADSNWSGWGGNVHNNRWAADNHVVKGSTIASLTQHCRLVYPQGTSATPVVDGEIVYYPTYNGSFYALDYKTCTIKWQLNVTDVVVGYAPLTPAQQLFTSPASRGSPQVYGDVVVFGTQAHALLVAADKYTGKVLDRIQLNAHELAVITMSPTVYEGNIFVGCSSLEEPGALFIPDYQCCSFIGNFLSLRLNDVAGQKKFAVNWNMSMLPAGVGWSGVGVWGSQPSIDKRRNQVFAGTGNVYRYPAEYAHCENETAACLPKDVYQESILALDIPTGRINWARKISPLDAWTAACGLPPAIPRNTTLCPNDPGGDSDFGMAPAFVPGSLAGRGGRDVLVVGQKNGILHFLAADDGTQLQSTVTSPDATNAGLSWGVAADDARAYFTGINSGFATWQVEPSGTTISNSAYGAASLANGTLLWETPAPEDAISFGPPTVVGDLVLVARTGIANSSFDSTIGGLVALKKATGEIVHDIALDANFHGGVAVQEEYVMFGTGYGGQYNGTGSFWVMKLDTHT
jgi:outer membrane protein assembly factor BamB